MPAQNIGLGASILRATGLASSRLPRPLLIALAKRLDQVLTVTVNMEEEPETPCGAKGSNVSLAQLDGVPVDLALAADPSISGANVALATVTDRSLVTATTTDDGNCGCGHSATPTQPGDDTPFDELISSTGLRFCCRLIENGASPGVIGGKSLSLSFSVSIPKIGTITFSGSVKCSPERPMVVRRVKRCPSRCRSDEYDLLLGINYIVDIGLSVKLAAKQAQTLGLDKGTVDALFGPILSANAVGRIRPNGDLSAVSVGSNIALSDSIGLLVRCGSITQRPIALAGSDSVLGSDTGGSGTATGGSSDQPATPDDCIARFTLVRVSGTAPPDAKIHMDISAALVSRGKDFPAPALEYSLEADANGQVDEVPTSDTQRLTVADGGCNKPSTGNVGVTAKIEPPGGGAFTIDGKNIPKERLCAKGAGKKELIVDVADPGRNVNLQLKFEELLDCA